jgi:hypothetical protein
MLAGCARAGALLLPLAVSGVTAVLVLEAFAGWSAEWRIVSWTCVVVGCIVAVLACVPLAHRLSALAVLLGLEADFPSPPPSRVRLAFGTSTMANARSELERTARADSTDELQTARMGTASMLGVFRTMEVRIEDRSRVFGALGLALCVAVATLIVMPDRAEAPRSPFADAPQAESPVTNGTTAPTNETTAPGAATPAPPTRSNAEVNEQATNGARSPAADTGASPRDATAVAAEPAPPDPESAGTTGRTSSAAGSTPSSATFAAAATSANDVGTASVADDSELDAGAATAPSVVPSPGSPGSDITPPAPIPEAPIPAAPAPEALPPLILAPAALAPTAESPGTAPLAPVAPAASLAPVAPGTAPLAPVAPAAAAPEARSAAPTTPEVESAGSELGQSCDAHSLPPTRDPNAPVATPRAERSAGSPLPDDGSPTFDAPASGNHGSDASRTTD